jgi:hypothetical protein
MQKYFRNVFMFSMNDEVVHTGYTRLRITSLCSAVQNVMFKVQIGNCDNARGWSTRRFSRRGRIFR